LSKLQRHAKEAISAYHEVLADTRTVALKLLTSDWMIPEGEVKPEVGMDMARIRRIYIPEVVIRLHALLYASRAFVQEALPALLELTNTIADSRYRLYDDFGDRLPTYLNLVRQAVLATLENGGADPFRMLA
ncbi:hypothetical protein BDZ89DRAFT_1150352, partial [Hymenopellis radicata]